MITEELPGLHRITVWGKNEPSPPHRQPAEGRRRRRGAGADPPDRDGRVPAEPAPARELLPLDAHRPGLRARAFKPVLVMFRTPPGVFYWWLSVYKTRGVVRE